MKQDIFHLGRSMKDVMEQYIFRSGKSMKGVMEQDENAGKNKSGRTEKQEPEKEKADAELQADIPCKCTLRLVK